MPPSPSGPIKTTDFPIIHEESASALALAADGKASEIATTPAFSGTCRVQRAVVCCSPPWPLVAVRRLFSRRIHEYEHCFVPCWR